MACKVHRAVIRERLCTCVHNFSRQVSRFQEYVDTQAWAAAYPTAQSLSAAAASPIRKQEPIAPNPLDIVPEKIPFDVPYGPPISLERAQAAINVAVAEAKNHDWKMNVAVVDSGGNLVAFQRMDGAMLASIQIAEHMARAAATFRRETRVFESGILVEGRDSATIPSNVIK